MSHSYRHTPIFGNACCNSEKKDKRICNRKIRRIKKQRMKVDIENMIDPLPNEVFNVWSMGCDGKHYWKVRPYNPILWWSRSIEKQREDIKKAMRK